MLNLILRLSLATRVCPHHAALQPLPARLPGSAAFSCCTKRGSFCQSMPGLYRTRQQHEREVMSLRAQLAEHASREERLRHQLAKQAGKSKQTPEVTRHCLAVAAPQGFRRNASSCLFVSLSTMFLDWGVHKLGKTYLARQ